MVIKKICMLGSFSVGKTSMVARFVQSTFSEKYLTTVGVKVDKKQVHVAGTDLTLMVWDLAGDDDYQKLNMSFLRGSAGFIYVADGTRSASLDAVLEIDRRVRREMGTFPSVLALNKADLAAEWQLDAERISGLETDGWSLRKTSAKLAQGVEETFLDLASRLIHA